MKSSQVGRKPPLQMFRVKQLSSGRPRPGAAVSVQVATIHPSGKLEGWKTLTYLTSSEKDGGRAVARRVADALNDVMTRHLEGKFLTATEQPFELHQRVKLKRIVDRFPHFSVPEGWEGEVVEIKGDFIAVKMDKEIVGAEEWDNEIHFIGTESQEDLELL